MDTALDHTDDDASDGRRRNRRSFRRGGAALAAGVLALSACGGGDSVSPEDFVRDLERICRDLERDLDDIDEPTDMASLASAADDARDFISDASDAMRELKAPDELKNDYDDFLDLVDDNIDVLKDLSRAAEAEDTAEVDSVNKELGDIRDDRNDLAEDLGADRCVTEPSTSTTDDPSTDTVAPVDSTTASSTVTAPPISQVPITSPDTVAVDPNGIATIDIAGNFIAPTGYTFQNADDDTLDTLKSAYAETPSLAANVGSVGTAYIVDSTDTISAVMFLTFWTEDIEGTQVEDAFLNELTSTAATTDTGTTPLGLEYTTYTDPDGTVGFISVAGDVTLWLLVQTGQEALAADLADGFITANAG